ncbi:MAG: ribosomal protein S18-alanine N-acetyltransferase [Euryarchaeota archaeon]|nr:ribosomal protein S18-alanine N-acetyltransferase [Euryarchaeota archaeon]
MIRIARAGDIPAIVQIEDRSFEIPWKASVFRSYLNYPGFVVYKNDDAIQGYAMVLLVNDSATLVSLAIHPDHRRQGVGTVLLRWCEMFLRETGYASMVLQVREKNICARSFYRKMGFMESGRVLRYYPNDNAVVMQKEL